MSHCFTHQHDACGQQAGALLLACERSWSRPQEHFRPPCRCRTLRAALCARARPGARSVRPSVFVAGRRVRRSARRGRRAGRARAAKRCQLPAAWQRPEGPSRTGPPKQSESCLRGRRGRCCRGDRAESRQCRAPETYGARRGCGGCAAGPGGGRPVVRDTDPPAPRPFRGSHAMEEQVAFCSASVVVAHCLASNTLPRMTAVG